MDSKWFIVLHANSMFFHALACFVSCTCGFQISHLRFVNHTAIKNVQWELDNSMYPFSVDNIKRTETLWASSADSNDAFNGPVCHIKAIKHSAFAIWSTINPVIRRYLICFMVRLVEALGIRIMTHGLFFHSCPHICRGVQYCKSTPNSTKY